ncbi:MAG: hypothetical protein HYZ53_15230 [Planctomycetes bacterium]|nr:hypothetical protein [Planctomycetota bacterium]
MKVDHRIELIAYVGRLSDMGKPAMVAPVFRVEEEDGRPSIWSGGDPRSTGEHRARILGQEEFNFLLAVGDYSAITPTLPEQQGQELWVFPDGPRYAPPVEMVRMLEAFWQERLRTGCFLLATHKYEDAVLPVSQACNARPTHSVAYLLLGAIDRIRRREDLREVALEHARAELRPGEDLTMRINSDTTPWNAIHPMLPTLISEGLDAATGRSVASLNCTRPWTGSRPPFAD